jgi:hypothetical protein
MGLVRKAPAASSAGSTPGSSASRTIRKRARKKWGSRNWLTPFRSQPAQASSAVRGGGSGSRSSTVTAWPSLASSIAAFSPQIPPPATTISAMQTLPAVRPPHPAAACQLSPISCPRLAAHSSGRQRWPLRQPT